MLKLGRNMKLLEAGIAALAQLVGDIVHEGQGRGFCLAAMLAALSQ